MQKVSPHIGTFIKHKSSQGQDSGTVYRTCYGSSLEKYGKNTLSFYTAHSQPMSDSNDKNDGDMVQEKMMMSLDNND